MEPIPVFILFEKEFDRPLSFISQRPIDVDEVLSGLTGSDSILQE